MSSPAADYLAQLLAASTLAQPVAVAARLGLADLLAGGPREVDDLAAATGTHGDSLHRLLRALVALGLLAAAGPRRFALTALGGLLQSDAAGSLRPLAELSGAGWRAASFDLLDSVRHGGSAFEQRFGQPLYDYLAEHPDDARAFHAVQAAHACALDLAPALDRSGARRVVDVGGGTGAVLARLLGQRPQLEGVLFDRPEVVAQAAPLLAAAGVEPRCRLEGGDFLTAVPPGGDLYLLCFVLHNWDDRRAGRILAACAAAMAPGARLFVVEGLLGDDSPRLALLDLEMMVFTAGGRERSEAEYRALLDGAGFEVRALEPTGSTAALIDARRR